MKEKEQTYTEALQRLEKIVEGLEQNQFDIDSLGRQLKEAKTLLSFCQKKLQAVETDVKKILSNE